MADVNLPFWLQGCALVSVKNAASNFWAKVQSHVDWQNNQIDALACDVRLLDLLAWERDIQRFATEDETTYRLRVKHAYANAKDAGSIAGFKRIFARLGVRYIEIIERDPELDWDIVTIDLEDNELSQKQELLEALIQHYGRTCRRYQYSLVNLAEASINSAEFDHAQGNNQTQTFIEYTVTDELNLLTKATEFNHEEITMVATL
ncbi:MAG: phage tail protein [Paraglaciecola sp.]